MLHSHGFRVCEIPPRHDHASSRCRPARIGPGGIIIDINANRSAVGHRIAPRAGRSIARAAVIGGCITTRVASGVNGRSLVNRHVRARMCPPQHLALLRLSSLRMGTVLGGYPLGM